ncbi:MAG TPA: hypothetical protein VGS41_00060 [Chthonomonadales bacterium]|nr:hypothetical protein [Chthonomonadales bacterium]
MLARRHGKPTAGDKNIDVDMILAAQALSHNVPVSDVVAATVNLPHPALFVPARLWTDIEPGE